MLKWSLAGRSANFKGIIVDRFLIFPCPEHQCVSDALGECRQSAIATAGHLAWSGEGSHPSYQVYQIEQRLPERTLVVKIRETYFYKFFQFFFSNFFSFYCHMTTNVSTDWTAEPIWKALGRVLEQKIFLYGFW